jgi:(2Fe-2S) ferredoxin
MHESERLVELARRTIAGDDTLRGRVTVRNYTCFGRCDDGPNMFVEAIPAGEDPDREPDGDTLERDRGFYPGNTEETIVRVLKAHCGEGTVVEELVDDY